MRPLDQCLLVFDDLVGGGRLRDTDADVVIDSSTMTCVTAGWSSTSRSNRASALGPNPAFGFSGSLAATPPSGSNPTLLRKTRLPEIPTLSTAGARSLNSRTRRLASTSGHRALASGVDCYPSAIEFPSATTTDVLAGANTSTRER